VERPASYDLNGPQAGYAPADLTELRAGGGLNADGERTVALRSVPGRHRESARQWADRWAACGPERMEKLLLSSGAAQRVNRPAARGSRRVADAIQRFPRRFQIVGRRFRSVS